MRLACCHPVYTRVRTPTLQISEAIYDQSLCNSEQGAFGVCRTDVHEGGVGQWLHVANGTSTTLPRQKKGAFVREVEFSVRPALFKG